MILTLIFLCVYILQILSVKAPPLDVEIFQSPLNNPNVSIIKDVPKMHGINRIVNNPTSSTAGQQSLEELEDGNVEYPEIYNNPYITRKPFRNQSDEKNDTDLNGITQEPLYLKVSGENGEGKFFERITYFDRNNYANRLPQITIEVGIGSELLITPNQMAKIFFEVTNNHDQMLRVAFMCQDERAILSRMEPREAWLSPKQTTIVTVTTYANAIAGVGYRNLVTFTVFGPSRVQKSAAMQVGTDYIPDNDEPRMTHRYTSDCTNSLLGNCDSATWSIEVTAQDRDTGLLQLSSNPYGLYFPDSYTAGTKEAVVGYYSGSCCQPKIQLTAIDLRNNRRSYTADAYYAPLSAGSIAAIVLGVLLLILIIAAIVVLCRTKCKKKDSMDLPTYRGGSGSQRRY